MLQRDTGGPQRSVTAFRGQTRWSWNAPASPYVASEIFFDRQGFLSERISGGTRWRSSDRLSLDVSYVFDARRESAGGRRHAISTSVRFQRHQRRREDLPVKMPSD